MVAEIQNLAGQYWHRVAGADTGLPPRENGHDEFAATWLKQARQNLHGLPIGVFSQWFAVPGFTNVAPHREGQNIVVIIPGSRYPHQAVVIGAHYDGEPASKGSAYDDTSGCAIMLALMRTLGGQWRKHGLPSRTIEFVLFDGEEQWVIGSGAYLYDLRKGALMPRPVMMIDEEQSGVGYPARPFGIASRPPMPAFAVTTAEQPYYTNLFGDPIPPKGSALQQMINRIGTARDRTFAQLERVYPGIRFRGGGATPFRQQNEGDVRIGANGFCCSDNGAFEVLGLPTFTYTGDYQYYNAGHPTWSYPYDQPQDTLAAMACDTEGRPSPGSALDAALAIPVVMSARLIDNYAPSHRAAKHMVVMSMPAVVGRQVEFAATGSKKLTWSFGNGQPARGQVVLHRYQKAGSYVIHVSDANVATKVRVTVRASLAQPHFWSHVPAPPTIIPWHPSQLAGTKGCS